MKLAKKIVGAALGALLLGTNLIASPAQARYVVTLKEVGSDVVATGSGPIDLTGLSFASSTTTDPAEIIPNAGLIITGPVAVVSIDVYTGFTGPASFGSGGATSASSSSGDVVGMAGSFDAFAVPSGYISDSALSDTSTYTGQTFSTLGVTPDTYVWTWGTGPDQNFTLMIGAVAILEPSSAALLGAALIGLLLAGKLRHVR